MRRSSTSAWKRSFQWGMVLSRVCRRERAVVVRVSARAMAIRLDELGLAAAYLYA